MKVKDLLQVLQIVNNYDEEGKVDYCDEELCFLLKRKNNLPSTEDVEKLRELNFTMNYGEHDVYIYHDY